MPTKSLIKKEKSNCHSDLHLLFFWGTFFLKNFKKAFIILLHLVYIDVKSFEVFINALHLENTFFTSFALLGVYWRKIIWCIYTYFTPLEHFLYVTYRTCFSVHANMLHIKNYKSGRFHRSLISPFFSEYFFSQRLIIVKMSFWKGSSFK